MTHLRFSFSNVVKDLGLHRLDPQGGNRVGVGGGGGGRVEQRRARPRHQVGTRVRQRTKVALVPARDGVRQRPPDRRQTVALVAPRQRLRHARLTHRRRIVDGVERRSRARTLPRRRRRLPRSRDSLETLLLDALQLGVGVGKRVPRALLAVALHGHRLLRGGDAGNVCAALAAIEALGLDAAALAPHCRSFRPLPHRLQTLGESGGLRYVNDSISTTPFAGIAALECFRQEPVAILVGGYDRGLDWDAFADYVAAHPPKAIIAMGQNGPRIAERLRAVADPGFALSEAADLPDAVAKARAALPDGGVVLLSPGAPSFGAYADYVARGRHFAELAGFDTNAISQIPGLGLA